MNTHRKLKIVIIGGSGFLGSKLVHDLSQNFDVIGTYNSRRINNLEYLDITDFSQTRFFFSKHNPDVTIHCAGMTRPDVCDQNKDLAFLVNVKATENILRCTSSKFIYFSTDYVFDGEIGNYSEADEPNPINFYGVTKLKAEEIILGKREGNVVLRVSGLYGYNSTNNEFIESLSRRKCVRRAVDCISSQTLIDEISHNLPYFFHKEGLYHLCGPGPESRYEFTRTAVDILSLNTKVVPVTADSLYTIAKRPKNSSLRTTKHTLQMSASTEGLQFVKQQMITEKYET